MTQITGAQCRMMTKTYTKFEKDSLKIAEKNSGQNRTDGRTDRRTDGRTDGQTDGQTG